MTQKRRQACRHEPFLAVLEYILIPKYINFYGKVHSLRRWTVGAVERLRKAWKLPVLERVIG
jgi:hypothetical protein